jgi:YHS domain-containing protein
VAAGDRDTAVESPASKITLGLDGYSPVALSKSRQWVRGKQEFAFNWQDVTYWMTSAEELREFEKNPRQFAPRLLGCDPVILWQTDRAIAGSTQFGAFFDGELYLFSTQDSRDQFKQNPIRYTQTRHVLRPEQVTRLR